MLWERGLWGKLLDLGEWEIMVVICKGLRGWRIG
jgi:hypothetical protein